MTDRPWTRERIARAMVVDAELWDPTAHGDQLVGTVLTLRTVDYGYGPLTRARVLTVDRSGVYDVETRGEVLGAEWTAQGIAPFDLVVIRRLESRTNAQGQDYMRWRVGSVPGVVDDLVGR